MFVDPKREQPIRSPTRQKIQQFKRLVENYRRHIVCFVVVYGIAAGLFLERCYCEFKPRLLVSLIVLCQLEASRCSSRSRLRFPGGIDGPP